MAFPTPDVEMTDNKLIFFTFWNPVCSSAQFWAALPSKEGISHPQLYCLRLWGNEPGCDTGWPAGLLLPTLLRPPSPADFCRFPPQYSPTMLQTALAHSSSRTWSNHTPKPVHFALWLATASLHRYPSCRSTKSWIFAVLTQQWWTSDPLTSGQLHPKNLLPRLKTNLFKLHLGPKIN